MPEKSSDEQIAEALERFRETVAQAQKDLREAIAQARKHNQTRLTVRT